MDILSYLNHLTYKGNCQKIYEPPLNINDIFIPYNLLNSNNYKDVVIYLLTHEYDFNIRYRLLNQVLDHVENTNIPIIIDNDEGHHLLVLILEEHYVNNYYDGLLYEHLVHIKNFFMRCLKYIKLDIYKNVSDNDSYETDDNGNYTIISIIMDLKNSIKSPLSEPVNLQYIVNGYVYNSYHKYLLKSYNFINDFISLIKLDYTYT